MKGIIDLFNFLIFFIFSIFLYRETTEENYIQMNGELVEVIVINLQGGRTCSAIIDYNQKNYKVKLAKTDCNNRVLIGEKITLKYLKEWDKFIFPEKRTLLIYYISLFFFLVPTYFLFKMIRKNFVKY